MRLMNFNEWFVLLYAWNISNPNLEQKIFLYIILFYNVSSTTLGNVKHSLFSLCFLFYFY